MSKTMSKRLLPTQTLCEEERKVLSSMSHEEHVQSACLEEGPPPAPNRAWRFLCRFYFMASFDFSVIQMPSLVFMLKCSHSALSGAILHALVRQGGTFSALQVRKVQGVFL